MATPARWRPMRSGSAIPSRYRPSMAKGSANSTTPCARCCRSAPARDDEDEEEAEDDSATRPIRVAIVGRPNAGKSTLINHLLGEERLLDQPRGRHHARFHRGRDRLEGPRLPRVRYRRPAPPLADRGEAGEAVGRGRAARGALCRSRRADDGFAEQVRGAGSAHRRSDRARGQGAGHRRQQMGSGRWQARADLRAAQGRRSLAAAGRRACRSSPSPG